VAVISLSPCGDVITPHTTSAGLTIVANVAIATGPALLGAPRSVVLNFCLLYTRVDIGIWAPEPNSQKRAYILHTLYKNLFNFFYFVWEFASA